MALEATVLCLDGSEYMRNGDYIPNRMEAMKDAASLLCRIKTDMNPESTVGIVACGLPLGPKVLCSCSQDMGALLSACANLSIAGGKADFVRSLEVSALALKHRRNKNGDQRVVVFVGSPVEEDEAALVKLAKKLKKNNICVDIVAMGEVEENEPKLKAFVEAVDKSNTSHLVVIPAGILPSEVLMTSPIITGSMGGEYGEDAGGAAGGAFAEYGGVDPRQDPELANALRASIEEARARMAAETASAEQASAQPANAAIAETPKAQPESAAVDDDEENLRLALQMSVDESEGGTAQAAAPSPAYIAGEEEEEDEDAKALAMALALSQQEDEPPAQSSATAQVQAPLGDPTGVLDPSYVKELMEGLGDVDINDPQIQQLLMGGANPPEEGPDSKKQKSDKEDENK